MLHLGTEATEHILRKNVYVCPRWNSQDRQAMDAVLVNTHAKSFSAFQARAITNFTTASQQAIFVSHTVQDWSCDYLSLVIIAPLSCLHPPRT